jgi:hypothetical protein
MFKTFLDVKKENEKNKITDKGTKIAIHGLLLPNLVFNLSDMAPKIGAAMMCAIEPKMPTKE